MRLTKPLIRQYTYVCASFLFIFLFSLSSFGQGKSLSPSTSDEPYVAPGTHYVQADPHELSDIMMRSASNPDLLIGPCEELNIVLILDASGSIDDDAFDSGQFSQNEQEIREATLGLATALNNSGGELAIIQFETTSQIVDIDGAGPGAQGYREINDDFIADLAEYLYPGGVNPPANGTSGYEAEGWTNWEDAFDDVIALNAIEVADLVLFMTDGNPTAYVNNDGSICDGCNSTASLNQAIPKADIVKNAGSHIYAIAVGENIDISNIIAMSGPDEDVSAGNGDGFTPANGDYTEASFEDLLSDFNQIAEQACNPAINIEKTVYAGHDSGASVPGGELVIGEVNGQVTYVFEITNTGDIHLDIISFTDATLGINNVSQLTLVSGSWPLGPLSDAPDNKIVYYYESTITSSLVNTASVIANPVDEFGVDIPNQPNETDNDTAQVGVELDVDCPGNINLSACADETAIASAYTIWEGSFQTSGGTNPGTPTSSPSLPPYICGGAVSLSYTYSVTDDFTTQSCTSTFNVAAALPLSISCPTDFVVQCLENVTDCDASDATVTGGCTPTVTCSQGALVGTECGGTITNTYTATDECGNTSQCTQVITVNDTTLPEIECQSTLNVDCSLGTTHPDEVGYPTYSDNCGNTSIDYMDGLTSGTCPYSFVRTWTATDACGNTAQCQQTIFVNDDTLPTVTCPSDTTIACGTSTLPAATGKASGGDDCGEVMVNHFDLLDPACGETGVISRTWRVTDQCGNSVTCIQLITIIDTIGPEISCPIAYAVQCIEDVPACDIADASATDNCSSTSVINCSQGALVGTECGGTITNTYTATDECGNTSQCTQVITIDDTTPPSITAPDNELVYCLLEPEVPVVGATDNCDTDVQVVFSEVTTNIDCKELTRTWTATDDCGNSTVVSQLITFIDTVAPVIGDVDPFVEIPCGAAAASYIDVSDDCDTALTIDYVDVLFSGDCGVMERTWIVTDDCGNSSTAVQLVQIIDNEGPVFMDLPADMTVDCPEDVTAAPELTAEDNCSSTVSIAYGESTSGLLTTRTWTATDVCGNSTVHVQTITVSSSCEDNCTVYETAPVDLTKSQDPVNGVQDRIQLKWFKASPEVKYTDEDAAACDIKFWEQRDLDAFTGLPYGPAIVNPDTINLIDVKKFYTDGVTPRSIFKWPVKYRADGANNAKRVKQNKRYQWQVRCACEHGEGVESPWSEVRVFSTPNFDTSTGIYSDFSESMQDEVKIGSHLGSSLDVNVFPNPSSGLLMIRTSEKGFTYEVRDMRGVILRTEQVTAGSSQVDLSDLSNGLYMIKVTSNGATSVVPFVLSR